MQLGIAQTLVALALVAVTGSSTWGGVDVSFRPDHDTVEVGQTVGVRIELSADVPASIAATDIVLGWDPGELRLLGLSSAGATPLLSSGFLRPDPYGLNEAAIPADGDAIYTALARLGAPLIISEEGGSTLLTTLLFEALVPTPDAEISILTSAGSPLGRTVVYGGAGPNMDVTGSLLSASVRVIPDPGTALVLLGGGGALFRRRRRHG